MSRIRQDSCGSRVRLACFTSFRPAQGSASRYRESFSCAFAGGGTGRRRAGSACRMIIADSPGIVRLLGSFGISTPLATHGPELIRQGAAWLEFAGQRSVNHCVLTLCLAGPCDRGNLCRRRPAERARRRGAGPGCGAGAPSCAPGCSSDCIAAGWEFSYTGPM
jgi:hypothetical protein